VHLAASVLACAAALTGCSSDDARPVGQSPAVTQQSPSDTVSRSTSAATPVVDRPTGITFRLPGPARGPVGSTRPGQDGTEVVSREYAAADGDVRLSVNLLTTPSRPTGVRRTVRAQYLPFLVVDTVRGQGATDAGVVSNSRLQDAPWTGYDSQLTFVQKGRRAVWFTRAIELPKTVVVVQAVAYVQPDEDAVDRVRASFLRLVDGLVIPS
jgi:hypothetical protein